MACRKVGPGRGSQKRSIKKMLIGTELVRELVESVILTGRIKDIQPTSLLLIAAPESGKTSIVTERPCTAVEVFADITGRGLHQVLKARGEEVTHIVINDMVAVLSHRQTVNKYTISQLNAYTEEGITALATPAGIERFNGGGRGGVIACLTLEMAKDSRCWWNKIGFSSRMLPFCYRYSDSMNKKIKDTIDANFGREIKIKVKPFGVPAHSLKVTYSEKYAREIRKLADERSNYLREDGKRRLKQYHAIVQAHAIWRSKIHCAVNDQDIDFIKTIDKYVSYDNPFPL